MEHSLSKPFLFKQFKINQDKCAMKVGTDGVLLGAWADVTAAKNILDIGSGTGVIALMLAQRTELAKIHAVEIDKDAFQQTIENMEACPWKDRLEAQCVSIQDFSKFSRLEFDLIVSNPPFFSGGTFSDNQDRNSVRHTVKLPHGELLVAARKLLSKEGRFCVVLPFLEGLRFQELASRYNLFCTKILEVKPKEDKSVERLLMQFEKKEKPVEKEELIIQKEKRNDWTENYKSLTGAFYLKM